MNIEIKRQNAMIRKANRRSAPKREAKARWEQAVEEKRPSEETTALFLAYCRTK